MTQVNPCLYIFGLLYIGSSIAVLIFSNNFSDKINNNPLNDYYTEKDISNFFNKSKTFTFSFSIEQKIRKNLRHLMDESECIKYQKEIINKKTDQRKLSTVFDVSLSFMKDTIYLYYYALYGVLVLLIYFYILMCFYCCNKSENCLTAIGCLLLPCYPCIVICFYIYGFLNLILVVILLYHYLWGNINYFVEFLDCSIVNKEYMMQKYSSIVGVKDELKPFLILLGVNFILGILFGSCSWHENNNAKNLHYELIAVYKVKSKDTSINN